MTNRFAVVLGLVLLLAVGQLSAQAEAPENPTACVSDYTPDTDYFPQKAEINFAAGFTVEYFDTYKVVTVASAEAPGAPLAQYVLVQCGTPAPEAGFETAQVIQVPVTRVVATSTTYLPFIDQIGAVETLVGLDSLDYASNANVIARIEADEITAVGGDTGLNMESLVALEPDLVLASPFDTSALESMQELGLPFAINADYLEGTPLGRAEWGKFIALFYNREAAAEEQFAGIAERYAALAALTADVEDRPTVFLSSPYEGTWYMAPAGSYTALLLEDAGAQYLWAEDEGTGTLVLDFETVLERAVNADYWLNPDQLFWDSLDDVVATDERFAEFAAYQNGTIFNNNARLNTNGWNDYYESAVAAPDAVLADLIAMFHPDLLPEHELYYYRQLDPAQ